MTHKFLSRGYPQQVIDNNLTKIQDRTRDSLLLPKTTTPTTNDRLASVSTYNPLSPRISKIIHKHWHIFKRGHPSLFSSPPMMSYRRGPNLRDQLVRADVGPPTTSVQTTISGSQNPGTFPCLGCAQCNNIQKKTYFTHPRNGHKFRFPGHFSCNSEFVVYLIKCPCGLAYVGEPCNALRTVCHNTNR